MNPILQELQQDSKRTPAEIAERLGMDTAEVAQKIAAWEADKTILGYEAVIDEDRAGNPNVVAFIEVKIKPEREGGFDRLAQRIAKFDQVKSCYLASGGYDLLVIVESSDLRQVARFVAERLSTIDGVLSTATHFQLKAYKLNGFLMQPESKPDRLPIAP
ncbi:MAG: Lrp/AsnC family transcriptional regulator [Verrucomicrobiales bacterium]